MSNDEATTRAPIAGRQKLSWVPLIAGVLLVAGILLGRLCSEQLFLFPVPVDREPFPYEREDASATARMWILPALAFLFVSGICVVLTSRAGPVETARDLLAKIRRLGAERPGLMSLFALACLGDLYTTWDYAQQYSMIDELHPGIKLVAYAFGITIGVAIAKAIQAGLVLVISALWPSAARTLILVLTGGYAAAAAWNSHWL